MRVSGSRSGEPNFVRAAGADDAPATGRVASAACLAALLLATAVGCRRPMPETEPATTEQDRVVGCWELDVTPGDTPEDSVPSWLSGAGLPTTLVLDSARARAAGDGAPIYEAHSYHGIRRESQPFSAWRPLSGDSILVDRPGALAGFAMRLAPDDDGGLSGILSSFTDVVEPGQPSRRTTPVRATRAACPSDGSGAAASSDG